MTHYSGIAEDRECDSDLLRIQPIVLEAQLVLHDALIVEKGG